MPGHEHHNNSQERSVRPAAEAPGRVMQAMFGGARGVFSRPKGEGNDVKGPPRPVKAFAENLGAGQERSITNPLSQINRVTRGTPSGGSQSSSSSTPSQLPSPAVIINGRGVGKSSRIMFEDRSNQPFSGPWAEDRGIDLNVPQYTEEPWRSTIASYAMGRQPMTHGNTAGMLRLPGILSGFYTSKMCMAMRVRDYSKLKSARTVNEFLKIFGAEGDKSTTSINEKFIKFVTESIKKTRNPLIGEKSAGSLKTAGGIIEEGGNYRASHPVGTEEFNRLARENLGIDPANLQAIKKVLALRKERITVRPVGEGETAEKAAAYQRLNLPTKPFSIKLKSETSSGFIPMNQFDIDSGKGAAPTSKTLTLYNQLMGVPDNAIEGATDMLKNLIGIYQQTMELNADPGPGVRKVLVEKLGALEQIGGGDEHLPDLKRILINTLPGSGNLDNHSGKTGGEILEKNPGLRGTLVSENLDPGKEYLVNNTKRLPIIGDYDLYRIYTPDFAKVKQGTESVEGAGDTTNFVLSMLNDLNIGAVLGGYEGGLLFHHGAEMHNEEHPQPKDLVRKITAEGELDATLIGQEAIAKDIDEEEGRGLFSAARRGSMADLRAIRTAEKFGPVPDYLHSPNLASYLSDSDTE